MEYCNTEPVKTTWGWVPPHLQWCLAEACWLSLGAAGWGQSPAEGTVHKGPWEHVDWCFSRDVSLEPRHLQSVHTWSLHQCHFACKWQEQENNRSEHDFVSSPAANLQKIIYNQINLTDLYQQQHSPICIMGYNFTVWILQFWHTTGWENVGQSKWKSALVPHRSFYSLS